MENSELYTKQYNDCLAEGLSELYARSFAKYYEIAILENRTTGYAYNFADAVGEFVANQFQSKDDYEIDEYFMDKLKEIMKEFETKQFK